MCEASVVAGDWTLEVHPLDAESTARVVALELLAGEASVEEVVIDIEPPGPPEP
jgi:hypothetical protein